MSEVDYVRLLPDEKAESEDCVSNPTGSDLILARDSVKHYVRRLNLIIILSAILSITLLDAAHIVLRSGEFPEYLYNIWFTSHTIDVIVLTVCTHSHSQDFISSNLLLFLIFKHR